MVASLFCFVFWGFFFKKVDWLWNPEANGEKRMPPTGGVGHKIKNPVKSSWRASSKKAGCGESRAPHAENWEGVQKERNSPWGRNTERRSATMCESPSSPLHAQPHGKMQGISLGEEGGGGGGGGGGEPGEIEHRGARRGGAQPGQTAAAIFNLSHAAGSRT